jgi:protease I
MARIAVLIGNNFEDSEYVKPAEAFQAAGYRLIHIGLQVGQIVKGMKQGTSVTIGKTANEVTVKDFAAILIPGGYSPDQLRVDDDIVQFIRQFVESGKPVFAICHGPQLLISARVLQGRTVTGWKSIVQDIKNAGAEYVDQQVVEDGNLITSRHPGDLPAFIEACMKRLQWAKAA